MPTIYILTFVGSFVLCLFLTVLVRQVAIRTGLLDKPTKQRKIHKQPVPLLGGLAVATTVIIVVFVIRLLSLADFNLISAPVFYAILLSTVIIMLGGYLDDKYNLKWSRQIVWPLLAVIITIIAGVKIGYVSNPFGADTNAIIYLSAGVGAVLTFIWLIAIIYTTKLLDGLDGLVGGIGATAAIVIFFLSLSWDVELSATGLWSLSLFASLLAFLVFNWHPAKIFLGEGGSIWIGYMLAVLSIISGSKIATTLLVLGVPIIDVFLVVTLRLLKKESPFSHADKKHMHYRLLSAGLSHREVVLLMILVSLLFGFVALTTSGLGKVTGMLFLIILVIFMLLYTHKRSAIINN